MNYDLDQVKDDLKARLSAHRFKHTESVTKTAITFARAYDFSLSEIIKIEIAAWLHDCCKELKNEELLQLADFYNIEIYNEDEQCPNVLHARVGAAWAEEEYDIVDPYIIYAIRDHTLGSAVMLNSSKILYLADMLEPLRGNNPELERLRAIVMQAKDLDKALLEAMNSKIKYVLEKNQPLHPLSIEARNALL